MEARVEKLGSTEMRDVLLAFRQAMSGATLMKMKHQPRAGGLGQTDIYVICQPKDILMIIDVLEKIRVHDDLEKTYLHLLLCLKENHSLVYTDMREGSKVDLFFINGSTPLLVRSYRFIGRSQNVRAEDDDVLQVSTLQTSYKTPALHMASWGNHKDIVCLLLRMGAKVGEKNSLGMTALHHASKTCAMDVIDILVDNGEDVNAKDCHGDTPLHLAASCKPSNVPVGYTYFTIKSLLCQGAKVLEKNYNLQTPYVTIHLAISSHLHKDHPLLEDREIRLIEILFIKHITLLQELEPQAKLDAEWKLGSHFRNKTTLVCWQELNYMKSVTIVKDISLYDVLFHKKAFRISSEDLKHIDELLCSQKLYQKCRIYTLSLRTTFQRSKLLTLAVQSFYTEGRKQMMQELPWDMAEKILTYLPNEDLRNFVKSE